MSQQVGPECELMVSKDRVYARCRGGPQDSLSDVVNATHVEWRWLWEQEKAFIRHVDLDVVRPD